jgi:hypothetical protein
MNRLIWFMLFREQCQYQPDAASLSCAKLGPWRQKKRRKLLIANLIQVALPLDSVEKSYG